MPTIEFDMPIIAPSIEEEVEQEAFTPDDILTPPVERPAFSPEDIFGLPETSTPIEGTEGTSPETSTPRRRRGRPPGSRNRPKDGSIDDVTRPRESNLRGRTAKELSGRSQQILTTVTGIPAVMLNRDHVKMSDEEARNICDPLSQYLMRQVGNEKIENFVERWDIIAVIVGVVAYLTRVIRDERDSRNQRLPQQSRPRVVEATATPGVGVQGQQAPGSSNGANDSQPSDTTHGWVSSPSIGQD